MFDNLFFTILYEIEICKVKVRSQTPLMTLSRLLLSCLLNMDRHIYLHKLKQHLDHLDSGLKKYLKCIPKVVSQVHLKAILVFAV